MLVLIRMSRAKGVQCKAKAEVQGVFCSYYKCARGIAMVVPSPFFK